MFEGFERRRVRTDGAEINLVVGGEGPPVLLLHGYPQCHVMWHKVAPELARHFTVVAADLRGYGDSSKPAGPQTPPESGDTAGDDTHPHALYSKRAMARDQVEAMAALGFDRFQVVGHDRGGRVAHRMALDHPDRVRRLAVLDIVPTLTLFETTDQAFATGYYHWFFLIQPNGLPEAVIGQNPELYLRRKIGAWGARGVHFTPDALAEYVRCFDDPATVHASCEDYRAAASIDLVHDRADRDAGRRIACPLLVLWGGRGFMGRSRDVLGSWTDKADDVRGFPLDCGHYLAEEKPEETLAALLDFLER